MHIWGHFKTITKHKILVGKLCFKVHLYKQGLLHDLSKYTPTEFITGIKYYKGTYSPNSAERNEKATQQPGFIIKAVVNIIGNIGWILLEKVRYLLKCLIIMY